MAPIWEEEDEESSLKMEVVRYSMGSTQLVLQEEAFFLHEVDPCTYTMVKQPFADIEHLGIKHVRRMRLLCLKALALGLQTV